MMMKIVVQRHPSDGSATMGDMFIDGVHQCVTLEPAIPIPAGSYDLVIDFSHHFQRLIPHVLNVPDQDGVVREDRGIRIHPGNWPKDTDGCTLVGEYAGRDFIGQSDDEFNVLFQLLQTALTQAPLTISYLDAEASPFGNTTSGSGID